MYSGSTNEDDLIEYLTYEEAAEEIAEAIVKKNEFHESHDTGLSNNANGSVFYIITAIGAARYI